MIYWATRETKPTSDNQKYHRYNRFQRFFFCLKSKQIGLQKQGNMVYKIRKMHIIESNMWMANWFIGPQEKPNQKQLAAKNATIAIFFREYICLKSNLNKSVYRNKNQRNECYRIKYVNGQLIYWATRETKPKTTGSQNATMALFHIICPPEILVKIFAKIHT